MSEQEQVKKDLYPGRTNSHRGVQNLKVIEKRWEECVRCPLCQYSNSVVLWDIPDQYFQSIPYLFIGEGPGQIEDDTGFPFVGKAGRLLRQAIKEVSIDITDCAFTNLVACRPTDDGRSNRPPVIEEIRRCSERLSSTVRQLKPHTIFLCGKVPESQLPFIKKWTSCYIYCIAHPSYVLRQGGQSNEDIWKRYLHSIRKNKIDPIELAELHSNNTPTPTPIQPLPNSIIKNHKARIHHICTFCDKRIPKGERYQTQQYILYKNQSSGSAEYVRVKLHLGCVDGYNTVNPTNPKEDDTLLGKVKRK